MNDNETQLITNNGFLQFGISGALFPQRSTWQDFAKVELGVTDSHRFTLSPINALTNGNVSIEEN